VAGKRFFSSDEIASLQRADGPMDPVAYSLRAPMAQFLAVTRDAPPGVGLCVRATTLCPLTWSPYSQAINIPLDDERVVRNLTAPGAECVLAEPTRDQLREIAICGQRAPDGICEADIARLKLCKSIYVDVPSIASCPVNLECVVDHVERYHTHLIAFTRVVGGSIDDGYLLRAREDIISIYPANFVDDVFDASGNVRRRVSLLRDIYPCPTFPCAPKSGWGNDFGAWMHDLRDEDYLSPAEHELLIAWRKRWDEVFVQLDSPERAALKTRLTDACRLIVQGRWAKLHAYLGEQADHQ
jgi:flavin reductase (DIM6/NTAB) family NADH-FMN oxidoreductase RutF